MSGAAAGPRAAAGPGGPGGPGGRAGAAGALPPRGAGGPASRRRPLAAGLRRAALLAAAAAAPPAARGGSGAGPQRESLCAALGRDGSGLRRVRGTGTCPAPERRRAAVCRQGERHPQRCGAVSPCGGCRAASARGAGGRGPCPAASPPPAPACLRPGRPPLPLPRRAPCVPAELLSVVLLVVFPWFPLGSRALLSLGGGCRADAPGTAQPGAFTRPRVETAPSAGAAALRLPGRAAPSGGAGGLCPGAHRGTRPGPLPAAPGCAGGCESRALQGDAAREASPAGLGVFAPAPSRASSLGCPGPTRVPAVTMRAEPAWF